MATDRSDKVYEYWREASEKLDYFITGLSGALVAYVGEGFSAARLGANPATVELAALAMLLISVVLGFKRIETNVTVMRIMHTRLYSEEARGALMAKRGGTLLNEATGDILSPYQVAALADTHLATSATAREKSEELTARSAALYRWRNRSLILGFVLLVASKILPAYM